MHPLYVSLVRFPGETCTDLGWIPPVENHAITSDRAWSSYVNENCTYYDGFLVEGHAFTSEWTWSRDTTELASWSDASRMQS